MPGMQPDHLQPNALPVAQPNHDPYEYSFPWDMSGISPKMPLS